MGISCNIFILGLFAAICRQKRGEAGLGMAGGAPGSPKGKLCTLSLFSQPAHSRVSSVHGTAPAVILWGLIQSVYQHPALISFLPDWA